MNIGIWLSSSAVAALSTSTRDEILGQFAGVSSPTSDASGAGLKAESSEEPSDFSTAQLRKLVDGCSDRPKQALRFIAERKEPTFLLSELIAAVGADASGGARGVLSAITRRTRTVLGDPAADFFWWQNDGLEDDWCGTVSAMTHASLRKVFGVQ